MPQNVCVTRSSGVGGAKEGPPPDEPLLVEDLTPLCAQPIAVDDSSTEAASTLTHAAKNALTSMAAGDLELRY